MSELSLRELRVGFGDGREQRVAVDGLSLTVPAGQTYALVGESGCGKSVSALSILRLLPAGGRLLGGEVRLGDENLLARTEAQMRSLRGGRIGMIFQEPGTSLNPVLTIGQQLVEVLQRHRGMNAAAGRTEAVSLLTAVGLADPARRCDEYPFQLSGGMKQRAMIAMALAGNPELLLADEPTTALDVTVQAQILALLRDLQAARRMSMLLITHDLGVVAQMAHRVGVMYAGQLVEEGPAEAFFKRPLHPYTRGLFAALPTAAQRDSWLLAIPGLVPPPGAMPAGCRFAPRCPHAWSRCHDEAPAWAPAGDDQWARCHLLSEPGRERDLAVPTSRGVATAQDNDHDVLRTEALQVHFPIRRGILMRAVGAVRAVDGVDLAVPRGRTLALVGESGCGKTTVGKALMQLVPPTGGAVWLGSTRLQAKDAASLTKLRSRVQMVFQDPFASLNPKRSVGEILVEGLHALKVGAAHERVGMVRALVEAVGLPADAIHRYPHEFSGGQRQRIAIARALAVQPEVLVCDEPTSALDVSVQAQILNLLRKLQQDLGLAYLFITHNFAVVEFMAHEVAVMYLGRIVESGPATQVLRQARHPYTSTLLAAVPLPDPQQPRNALRVAGETPSAANPPPGCHFHPRCPHAGPRCRREYPTVTILGDGHQVRCHLHDAAGVGD